jgi:hypothetical protein
LDSASNSGLAGGEIKFYFKDITGTFSSQTTYLGKTITGGDGNYSFKFDGTTFKNVFGYYYAEAFKGELFHDPYYGNRVSVFDLDTSFYNIPFIQNFSLFRPATLKIRIIASSVTNFQFLTVSYDYGKLNNGVVINGGRQIDTTITFKTAGDIRTFVQADANGNGVNLSKKDTVIIPTNNTRQIELRF